MLHRQSSCDAFCVALVRIYHPHTTWSKFSERSNVLLRWNKDDSCLGATAVGAGTLQTFTVSWTISVRSWRTAVCIRKHAGICILEEFQKQVAYNAYTYNYFTAGICLKPSGVLMDAQGKSSCCQGMSSVEPFRWSLRRLEKRYFRGLPQFSLQRNELIDVLICRDMSWYVVSSSNLIHEDICLEVLCQALGAGGRY